MLVKDEDLGLAEGDELDGRSCARQREEMSRRKERDESDGRIGGDEGDTAIERRWRMDGLGRRDEGEVRDGRSEERPAPETVPVPARKTLRTMNGDGHHAETGTNERFHAAAFPLEVPAITT